KSYRAHTTKSRFRTPDIANFLHDQRCEKLCPFPTPKVGFRHFRTVLQFSQQPLSGENKNNMTQNQLCRRSPSPGVTHASAICTSCGPAVRLELQSITPEAGGHPAPDP